MGISVYNTENQVRKKARGVPILGAYIAELTIPDYAPVYDAKTTKSSGHYTLWGRPAAIMSFVGSITPVQE